METYSNVYISIHYCSAELDSKYRSIQKQLPSKENQTKLYLFYHLESQDGVEMGVPLLPLPFHTSSFSTVSSIIKTGSILKYRNALCLDFTALTHLCFSVALYIYILALVVNFCFQEVIGKILIDFCSRACNL